jgi:hypothetical protein
MALTKKIYKIKKNSFKNLKTKKNKSKKVSIVLQKSKNKHNSLKKNKLIKGGAKSIGESIYINSKYLKCPASSSYVQMLNIEFLKENNIKYRKKIKKIACEFVEYKNSLTSNTTEQYKNIFDEPNFLVFMCYFFDDAERTYINHKQCKPNNNYYNNEEKNYVVKEKCPKKREETIVVNNIYASINNNDIYSTIPEENLSNRNINRNRNRHRNRTQIIYDSKLKVENKVEPKINSTWVEFLNIKLSTEDTTEIRTIIINTLKEYIINKDINTLSTENSSSIFNTHNTQKKLEKMLGIRNTAIEFIQLFDDTGEIKKLLLSKSSLYARVNKTRKPLISSMATSNPTIVREPFNTPTLMRPAFPLPDSLSTSTSTNANQEPLYTAYETEDPEALEAYRTNYPDNH